MINDKEHYRHMLNSIIDSNTKMVAVMEARLMELKMARAENKDITEEWMNDWQYRWNADMIYHKMKISDDCNLVRDYIPMNKNL